jgi:hypothetical protein
MSTTLSREQAETAVAFAAGLKYSDEFREQAVAELLGDP